MVVAGEEGAVFHLDAVGVDFVGFEGAVEGEGGLGFALQVFWVVFLKLMISRLYFDLRCEGMDGWIYLPRPTLIPRIPATSLVHEIRTLFIIVPPAKLIRHTGRDERDTIQGLVPLDSIPNILLRRRLQGLGIARLERAERRGARVSVPGQQRSVVGSIVMVCAAADGRVETVDRVWAGEGLLLQVRGAVGFSAVTPNDVERLVGFVAGVALSKRATSSTGSAAAGRGFFVGGWGVAVGAGSVAAGCGFGVAGEGFGAVLREGLLSAA